MRPAAPRARWLRPARRLALAGVAATAVAAGVATALIVVPGSGGQPGAGPATRPGPVTGHRTAARFLHAAARAALQQSTGAST